MAVIGVVSSYFVPKALNRQAERKKAAAAADVSWQGLSNTIMADRDRLQKKVDELEDEIKALNAELQRRPPAPTDR